MKKWVVGLVEVDEDALPQAGLPKHSELGSLPDRLADAVHSVAPGAVELDAVFLLSEEQKTKLEVWLENHSMPYHEYAVESRGERCVREGCKKHLNQCVVIRLHDHRKQPQKARRGTKKE